MNDDVDPEKTLIIKNNFSDQNLKRWLILLDGKGENSKSFELIKPITTIGRDSNNDIVLNDKTVSRIHCSIQLNGNDLSIVEKNSVNGICLNGYPRANAKLTDGMNVRLGKSEFIVKLL